MIRTLLRVAVELLQRVPDRIRGWVYLGLAVACLAYIGVTAWRSGFSVDQIIALIVSLVGALANAHRPTVKARTGARRRPDNTQE